MTLARTFSKQRLDALENGEVPVSLGEFGSRFLTIRVPQERDDERQVVMILFEDRSGVFGELKGSDEAPSIAPWTDDLGVHFAQELFQIDPELVPEDLAALMSREVVLREEQDHNAIEAIFKQAARAVPDAPEGLLDYMLQTQKDWTWEDPETSDAALTLLAQVAWLLAGGHGNIEIHANCEDGRSPAQIRQEAFYQKLGEQYDMPPFPGQEANYAGKAYAIFSDEQESSAPDCLQDYASKAKLSAILSVLSTEILEDYGRPEGWQTNYNDGAGERTSGYSADSEVEHHDTGFLSAHEVIEAHHDVAEFIREKGLKPRILDIIEREQLTDHNFAALVRGLD